MTYTCSKCGKKSKTGTLTKVITLTDGKKEKKEEKFVCADCEKGPLG
jgi:DNA-directed RNA polymerase subunit RPC12/RpoP